MVPVNPTNAPNPRPQAEVDAERATLARAIDAHLAAAADAWRRIQRLDRGKEVRGKAAGADFRNALASHGLPGGYAARGEVPQPLALRLIRVSGPEAAAIGLRSFEPISQPT
jgi:hypothetical protein